MLGIEVLVSSLRALGLRVLEGHLGSGDSVPLSEQQTSESPAEPSNKMKIKTTKRMAGAPQPGGSSSAGPGGARKHVLLRRFSESSHTCVRWRPTRPQ